jgi:hypothetical protein
MTDISYYRTPDINLASTLFTLGIGIDGIYAVENTERMEFYFKNTPELEKMITDYWIRKLRVEPQELLLNRSEIISRLKHEQTHSQKSS